MVRHPQASPEVPARADIFIAILNFNFLENVERPVDVGHRSRPVTREIVDECPIQQHASHLKGLCSDGRAPMGEDFGKAREGFVKTPKAPEHQRAVFFTFQGHGSGGDVSCATVRRRSS